MTILLLTVYIFCGAGWILIDRCGKHFSTILNFLRDGSVPLPETRRELLELQKEAKYYLIEELVRTIEAQLVSQTQVDPICKVPLITSQKEEQALVGSTAKVSQMLSILICSGAVRIFKISNRIEQLIQYSIRNEHNYAKFLNTYRHQFLT